MKPYIDLRWCLGTGISIYPGKNEAETVQFSLLRDRGAFHRPEDLADFANRPLRSPKFLAKVDCR